MQVEIVKTNGKKSGKQVDLADDIFGVESNEHAVYLTVKQYLANQRQGTHKTKERWEVAFSTKKLGRQKGGGGARRGSRKSGLLKGGGTFFGPQPRDYGFKLNAKVKDLARRSVLSEKAKENAITIVEDYTFDTPKTKQYIEILKNLGLETKKTLVILSKPDGNMSRAGRNFAGTKITTVGNLNTYDVLNAHHLLFTESAVADFNKNKN